MSSCAHGRSAINILVPSVAPSIHSAPRRYFCSSSFRRNLGLYPPRSRQIVLRQSEKEFSSKKRLIYWSSCGGFSKSRSSLDVNHSTSIVSHARNSEWPRASAILFFGQRIQNGEEQHGGLLIRLIGRRCKSSSSKGHEGESFKVDADGNDQVHSSIASPKPTIKAVAPNKHIISRLPNIKQIHRPTKEELLAAATGFWARLKVRFKWFSIRSARPFNIDEIGAFFSWILVGHVIWIILGTTTFFSLAIFAVNTVFAQGKINLLMPVVLNLLLRRDISSLGRELPNKIFGSKSRFRVGHSAQMG